MAIHYKKVMCWGRSYDEYCRMFHLTKKGMELRFLGCGDGSASFNGEMARRNCRVVSVDPIYRLSAEDIENSINENYGEVIDQTYANREKFIWKEILSVDDLGKIRMKAMRLFLKDFEKGKAEGRYIPAELPSLPFRDAEFDLALSSHFLFLYTENLTFDFHMQAIREMLRVAHEVRIFPLLDANGILSSYADAVCTNFINEGKTVVAEEVPYEFQKGGNKMLKIRNKV